MNLMTSISGFGSLRTIGQDLILDHNDALTDISGLMGIDTVGRHFSSTGNGLTTAQAAALRDAIGVSDIGGTITISE